MLPELLAAIPAHPESRMPLTPEMIFTVFLAIPVGLFLYFAIKHLAAGKRPLLLACLAGGLLACVWEPIVDTMGLCYIKEGAELHMYTLMDREMPLFIPFVYIWYVGGLAYVAYRLFAAGITRRGLFTLYLVDVFVNIWLESPGVLMGAYEYYGPQPLNFWGLPLWWVLMNPLMPILGGALIYRLEPHLTGLRTFGIIPIIPMVDGLVNAAIGWPMWLGLNGDFPTWATHITAAMSFGLALYAVWMLSFLVARPAEQVRRISKRELVREAFSGDAPPPPPEPRAPAPAVPVPTPQPVGAG